MRKYRKICHLVFSQFLYFKVFFCFIFCFIKSINYFSGITMKSYIIFLHYNKRQIYYFNFGCLTFFLYRLIYGTNPSFEDFRSYALMIGKDTHLLFLVDKLPFYYIFSINPFWIN